MLLCKIAYMLYKFINNNGTFKVKNPHQYNTYFPLTNKDGSLLSSISPNLAGDIKKDNNHFLTIPCGIEDIRNNLLCRREFFIKTENQTIRLSQPYKDTLEAGLFYHKIIKIISPLKIEIITFIPYEQEVEITYIKVTNTSNKALKITPTSFLPLYGRSEKNLRDHRHVSSLLNRIALTKYGLLLKPTMIFDENGHKINETTYFVLGYEDNAQAPQGQFPTLDYFCGKNDITCPDAVEKNIAAVKHNCREFNGKETCAAFRFKKTILKKNETKNYVIITGITDNKKGISAVFKKLNSISKINNSLAETKQYWQNKFSRVEFDFKDADFNNWLIWVKTQASLRKLFGCSFLPHFDYGKGGRGWRDLWQDALTLLITEPVKAKDLIFSSLAGIRVDGSNATIITKDGRFISDRNHISRVWMDHGVWPYLTLSLYINISGDLDILLKETTYFKDHLLKRAQETDTDFSQKDCRLRTSAGEIHYASVLEHILIQNLTAFFNVGEHNIIRLENADWNDGLDMAAQRGESCAFSFMYARNLNKLCFLLKELKNKTTCVLITKELLPLLDRINSPINYSNYQEKQKLIREYLNSSKNISGEKTEVNIDALINDLADKSRHLFNWLKEKEWLKEGFFNGYYDNTGRQAEGKHNKHIRMLLASQVFAIMSGGLDPKQIKQIWLAIKKRLQDKKLGGFHLNTDFKSIYPELGRAFGFSYGDKENGAVFNHMAVMLGFALYQENFIKEGWEVINSIYSMAKNKQACIYPMIPEYFNTQGKGLYLYLTGSASWYIYTLIDQILGVNFTIKDIIIKPKLLSVNMPDNEINYNFSFAGKKITLTFINTSPKSKNPLKIQKAFLGKKEIPIINSHCLIKKSAIIENEEKEINLKINLN